MSQFLKMCFKAHMNSHQSYQEAGSRGFLALLRSFLISFGHFVYTEDNFHIIEDDLVNSYHFLLCCLDLIFASDINMPK